MRGLPKHRDRSLCGPFRNQSVHLSRTYFLAPEEGARKGYLLLLKGMQETDRVAITRFVMRGKGCIGVLGFAEPG